MDELTHTVVATSLIAGAYYAGQFLKKRLMIESIIVSILETLGLLGITQAHGVTRLFGLKNI